MLHTHALPFGRVGPGPKRANAERAREEKTEADGNGNGTRPAKEGRTEAPEPTYHSETYAYLPNLPGEGERMK
jgi:hypothetical protein